MHQLSDNSQTSLYSSPATFAMMESPTNSVKFASTLFTYDANGNMLTEVAKTFDQKTQLATETKTTTQVWDSQNRLIASQAPGKSLTFKYNAQGNRVEKAVDGIITRYLYEGKHCLLELAVHNATLAKNVRGLTILKRNVTGKELSYFFNAHGDVTALLDRSGALAG